MPNSAYVTPNFCADDSKNLRVTKWRKFSDCVRTNSTSCTILLAAETSFNRMPFSPRNQTAGTSYFTDREKICNDTLLVAMRSNFFWCEFVLLSDTALIYPRSATKSIYKRYPITLRSNCEHRLVCDGDTICTKGFLLQVEFKNLYSSLLGMSISE